MDLLKCSSSLRRRSHSRNLLRGIEDYLFHTLRRGRCCVDSGSDDSAMSRCLCIHSPHKKKTYRVPRHCLQLLQNKHKMPAWSPKTLPQLPPSFPNSLPFQTQTSAPSGHEPPPPPLSFINRAIKAKTSTTSEESDWKKRTRDDEVFSCRYSYATSFSLLPRS